MDKRKKVIIVLAIIALLVALGIGGYLGYRMISENLTEQAYKDLADRVTETTPAPVEIPSYYDEEWTQAETKPVSEKDSSVISDSSNNVASGRTLNFEELAEVNSDVYAWIYIPNTNINYPVCQSALEDNFYLHHDVFKNSSFPGAIYSQLCNSRDWSDRVTVLYGHNMANGTMFGNLHHYENASFFNSNKYFYIYTKNRRLTYEVISAFEYDDKHIMNSFNFRDDSVFQNWIDEAKNPHSLKRNVNPSVKLDLNSKIVVLSTCPNYSTGRYIVQGVLISDEQTQ